VLRVTARDRMVFQLAKTAGKGHMLGAAELLLAQEQHLVRQQQAPDVLEQALIPRGVGKLHAAQFSPRAEVKGRT